MFEVTESPVASGAS